MSTWQMIATHGGAVLVSLLVGGWMGAARANAAQRLKERFGKGP